MEVVHELVTMTRVRGPVTPDIIKGFEMPRQPFYRYALYKRLRLGRITPCATILKIKVEKNRTS